MKNVTKIWLLAVIVFLVAAGNVFAQSVPFTIDAEILSSSTATFNVSKVTPPGTSKDDWQAYASTNLDFGTLTLDTDTGIFAPAQYYVIDVGVNGAGNPDIDTLYSDTANPNGAPNDGTGLGRRGTVAYSEVITNLNGTQTVNLIRGESLSQADGGLVGETQFAAGFLRVSVGIATGDPTLQEGNAVPFTTLDQPGVYSGTLTISATFDSTFDNG